MIDQTLHKSYADCTVLLKTLGPWTFSCLAMESRAPKFFNTRALTKKVAIVREPLSNGRISPCWPISASKTGYDTFELTQSSHYARLFIAPLMPPASCVLCNTWSFHHLNSDRPPLAGFEATKHGQIASSNTCDSHCHWMRRPA